LFAELTELIKTHAPQLLEQRSIGTVTAAVIIGRTAGAQRFRSEACFARHAGTAPIPANSGKTVRYRLHRGGDRQLNRAIHIIALGRVARVPGTRAYITRKQSEGKTKLEAIRCLKRHIARQIWHLLHNGQPGAPAPTPTAHQNTSKATLPHSCPASANAQIASSPRHRRGERDRLAHGRLARVQRRRSSRPSRTTSAT
jgi:hypothetical protein